MEHLSRSNILRRRFVAGVSTVAIPLIAGCTDDDSVTIETDELPEIKIDDVSGISDTGLDDLEIFVNACEERLLEHDFQLYINDNFEQSSEPLQATVDWDSQSSLVEDGADTQFEHQFTTPSGQISYADDEPTIRLDSTFEDTSSDLVAQAIDAVEEGLSLFEFGEPSEEENKIRLPVTGLQDDWDNGLQVESGELIIQEYVLFSALNVTLDAEDSGERVFDIEITAGEITLDTPEWAEESIETIEERESHDPEVVDRVADVSPADSVRIDAEIDDNRTTLIEQKDVLSVQGISSQRFYVSVHLDGNIIDHMNETVGESELETVTLITVLDGSDIMSETLNPGLHNQIRMRQWESGLLGFSIYAPDEPTAEQIAATLIES